MFPINDYWWIYTSFLMLVCAILYFDLKSMSNSTEVKSTKSAALWVLFWVGLSLTINYCFYLFAIHDLTSRGFTDANAIAHRLGLEFLTGYIIELALSVDNLFVFIVLFSYFGIEPRFQHRILFYGILGALFFRGLFIAIGSAIAQFEWVMIGLGLFLIFTGIKLVFSEDNDIDPSKSFVMKTLERLGLCWKIGGSTQSYAHDFLKNKNSFFIINNGRLYFTTAFVCLLFVEMTDIVFATDSVPAIFAITKDPMIVFLSNVCAILGLRSVYFLLSAAIQFFEYLKYGLALILVFIGAKMGILHPFLHIEIPTVTSLAFVVTVLIISTLITYPIKFLKSN